MVKERTQFDEFNVKGNISTIWCIEHNPCNRPEVLCYKRLIEREPRGEVAEAETK